MTVATAKIAQPKASRVTPTHEIIAHESIAGEIWPFEEKSEKATQGDAVHEDTIVAAVELPKPSQVLEQAQRTSPERVTGEVTKPEAEQASHEELPQYVRAQTILPKPQRAQIQQADQLKTDVISGEFVPETAEEVSPDDIPANVASSALVKLPQPTRAHVQATELRTEVFSEGVTTMTEQKATSESVTFESSVASVKLPKPTRATMQAAAELKPEDFSEGLSPVLPESATSKEAEESEITMALQSFREFTEVQPVAERVSPDVEPHEFVSESHLAVLPLEISLETEITKATEDARKLMLTIIQEEIGRAHV